ncbi:MAG: phosphoribosylglycinamide formyltransferase [Pseudomonadota bacterium]
MAKVPVAILISGRGSNMAALLRAALAEDYPAEVVLVLSNVPSAEGILHAQEKGIPFKIVDHKAFETREEHDEAVSAALTEAGADYICLAGYMRILTEAFVNQWRGRLMNMHPSLLPSFPGVDTHARALERGVRVHGCTVHFVNNELDGGPIIAQSAVPVLPGDDADTLGARVLEQEHVLFPHVLALVATRTVRWSGDNAVIATDVAAKDLCFWPMAQPETPAD